MFGHDLSFWLAIIGAVVFRLLTSPSHSFLRAFAMILGAVFMAWAFTDPVLKWLVLNPDDYRVPVAALLALTGEGLLRSLVSITASPEKLLETFKSIMGRK